MVSGYVTVFSGVVNFCSGEFAYIIGRERVDPFATYAYSCRICPLEFFIVFGL